MSKIQAFQEEHDLCNEFWYRHSSDPVTHNVSTGYITIWMYHNGGIDPETIIKELNDLSNNFRLEERGWVLPWKYEAHKSPTWEEKYLYKLAFELKNPEDIKKYLL